MVNNTIEVKLLNKEKIRRVIQKYDRFTKSEVSKETGLSVATCGYLLNDMELASEIIKKEIIGKSIGRPATEYTYNPDFQHILACFVISDSISDDNISVKFVLANSLGECIKQDDVFVEKLDYQTFEDLIADHLTPNSNIKAIGIGLPGVVSKNGFVTNCDVPELENINVVQKLKEKFGIEVLADNDANFMAYSLYQANSSEKQNFAFIYLPDKGIGSVGCGIICEGKLLKGNSTFAGELSYIAEIFGISRKEQQNLYRNKATSMDFLSKMVICLTCTIDPSTIIISNKNFNQQDCSAISNYCEGIISKKHVPKIQIDNNILDNYLNGVISLTLDHIQFNFS